MITFLEIPPQGTAVPVAVGEALDVLSGVLFGEPALVGVSVTVIPKVSVRTAVGVKVGVGVAVGSGVNVGVGVGVAVGITQVSEVWQLEH